MMIRVAEAIVDVLHGINQKYMRYDLIGKSYIIRGILTVGSFCAGLAFTGNLMVTLMIMAGLNLLTAFVYDWIHTGKLEEFSIRLKDSRIRNLLTACIFLFAEPGKSDSENNSKGTVRQRPAWDLFFHGVPYPGGSGVCLCGI